MNPSNILPITLSNAGQTTVSLEQAINVLRPNFVQRNLLRQELQNISKNLHTYFATIPKDIVIMIAEYMPDLRQSHATDPLQHIRHEYDIFVKKYSKTPDNPAIFDYEKTRADFPLASMLIGIMDACFIKNISQGVVICNVIDHARYIGNNLWIADANQSRRLFNGKSMKFIKFDNKNAGISEIHILPCGLVIISVIDNWMICDEDHVFSENLTSDRDIYLVDFVTDQFVPIHHAIAKNKYYTIIDDFGAIYDFADQDIRIAAWSHLTSECTNVDFA